MIAERKIDMEILKLLNVKKYYGTKTNITKAVNDLSLQVTKGEFVAIMGASGSGKSTLLHCLSSLDQVTTGTVKVLGDLVNDLNDFKLSAFRYKYLGFVFQNHNLISTLSIFDNIATPIMLAKVSAKEIIERVNKVAQRLNIHHILDKLPEECSGGEKQRAAIARAIINNPKIIICDEPTGNLDSKNSHEVLNLLSQLNKEGTAIILVTHDSMIASYAKTFMYIRDGSIKTVLHRNNSSQVAFFKEINKITTEDSLLKLFNNEDEKTLNKDEAINESNKNVIKENIDYSSKKTREDVYAVFKNRQISLEAKKCRLLYVNEDKLEYDNIFHEHRIIFIESIKEVTLSFVAIFKLLGVFSEYIYNVAIDIKTDDDIYQFKLENIDDLSELFEILNKDSIVINDPIGIQEIYKKYPDYLTRHRYIQRNYKKFKKKINN